MQLDLIILTKIIRYCELFRQNGKMLSTHITNDLVCVIVLVEDGSQQSATFTHAFKGSRTFMPTHIPSGPALSYPLQALQAKHK
jgi:hypothetical protein